MTLIRRQACSIRRPCICLGTRGLRAVRSSRDGSPEATTKRKRARWLRKSREQQQRGHAVGAKPLLMSCRSPKRVVPWVP